VITLDDNNYKLTRSDIRKLQEDQTKRNKEELPNINLPEHWFSMTEDKDRKE